VIVRSREKNKRKKNHKRQAAMSLKEKNNFFFDIVCIHSCHVSAFIVKNP
jgi:hypothetical protein